MIEYKRLFKFVVLSLVLSLSFGFNSLAKDITLGSSPTSGKLNGNGAGIMVVGDSFPMRVITYADDYEESTEGHYITDDGLQGVCNPGYTTSQVIDLVEASDVDQTINSVMIYCGINNLIRGQDYTDYTKLVKLCRTKWPYATVYVHLVAGPDPSVLPGLDSVFGDNYTNEKLDALNGYLASLSAVKVVNYFESDFTDSNFCVKKGVTSLDGIHPDDAYGEMWVKNIYYNLYDDTNYEGTTYSTDTGKAYIKSTQDNLKISLYATGSSSATGGSATASSSTSSGSSSATAAGGSASVSDEVSADLEVNMPGQFTPKVTSIHSINAALASEGNDVYFVPMLSDFPISLKNLIESGNYDSTGLYHGFAAAYDGEYDLESVAQNYSKSESIDSATETVYYKTSPEVYKAGQATRALETLGYDFLLSGEKVTLYRDGSLIKAKYTPVRIDEDDADISTKTAVMLTYKALKQYCFDMQITFTTDTTLQPETSPIQKEISLLLDTNGDTSWDNTEGSAWVFATRTNSDLYWSRATSEGIIKSVKNAYGTFQPSTSADTITLAEFCQLVKTMMDIYGEPVMTDDEKSYLLQLYGKYIPYYLEDEGQVDAIEYLAAKGIVVLSGTDITYNWTSSLTTETMLDILMRVADTSSRATFKDVQLTLDVGLLNMGYYETEISVEQSPIVETSYTDWDTSADSTKSSFDYLIDTSYFEDEEQLSKIILNGSNEYVSYNGLINVTTTTETKTTVTPYYWFSISRSVTEDSDGTFTINDQKDSYATFEAGGGVYRKSKGALKRTSFLNIEDTSLSSMLDKDKWADMAENAEDYIQYGNTLLADNDSIPVSFALMESSFKEDIKKVKFNGVSLEPLAGVTRDSTSSMVVKLNGRTITFTVPKQTSYSSTSKRFVSVSGLTSYDEFTDNISFDQSLKSESYKVFMKSGSDVLVSTEFLMKIGVITSVNKLSDTRVQLISDGHMIIVEQTSKLVTSGNTVYKMGDSSTLIYMKGNTTYVDWRAALGVSQPYMLFTNTDTGNVTFSLTDSTELSGNVTSRNVTLPFGTSGQSTNSILAYTPDSSKPEKTYIQLAGNDPLGNYMVYRETEDASSNGSAADYLFVFKNKNSMLSGEKVFGSSNYQETDDRGRTLFKEKTGIELDDNYYVSAYKLSTNVGERKMSSSKNPPGITYSKWFGYMYKPYKVKNSKGNFYKRYFYGSESGGNFVSNSSLSNGNSSAIVLPYVLDKDNVIVNINFNIFKYDGEYLNYGTAPAFAAYSSNEPAGQGNNTVTYNLNSRVNNTDEVDKKKIVIEPAEVNNLTRIIGLENSSWTSVAGSSKTTTVYYGTMKTSFQKTSKALGIAGYVVADGLGGGSPFIKLAETSNTEIYAYITSTLKLTDTSIGNMNGQDTTVNVSDGTALDLVNWDEYDLEKTLGDADDIMTIFTRFIIEIIPRIVVYLCYALIGLSTIVNAGIWQRFCDRYFDIYRLLTLGRKDVHTINPLTVVFSSVIGIAVFYLFMDASIIRFLGWIAEALVGITTR